MAARAALGMTYWMPFNAFLMEEEMAGMLEFLDPWQDSASRNDQ
jgi:hypothetical protein